MFSVVVQLGQPVERELPTALVELARTMGFELSLQFPGVDDETLRSFVIATTSATVDLSRAAERFRSLDSVIAAYPAPQPSMP